ncbi:hypothetical protein [Brucella oryzae]|uniref:hypothetical protein n=1 Tax=Brucella oryzae TaxID=335286 RepID=UPI0035BC53FB
MSIEDWPSFGKWHELFDRLCQLRGYSVNADLANDFCHRVGRSGESDFRAIEKNLRDWRLGRRVPLRRNALVLSRLLEVDSDPILRTQWDATYRALVERHDYVPGHGPGGIRPVANRDQSYRIHACRRVLPIAVVITLPVGLLAAVGMNGREATGPASVDKTELPTIAYNARAFLSPGAEKLIHGVVEGCDGAPSEWSDLEAGLPASKTGSFVDGGLATQMMNGCGKEMAVRAIKFVAARPGVEELKVFDAYFKIEVAPPLVLPD